MNALEQKVSELRRDKERLEDKVAALEDALGSHMRAPRVLNLTRQQEQIFCCLYKRGFAERDTILAAMYGANWMEFGATKNIEVPLVNIRKKCAPHGIEIKTIHSRGYEMTPESQRIVHSLFNMQEQIAGEERAA